VVIVVSRWRSGERFLGEDVARSGSSSGLRRKSWLGSLVTHTEVMGIEEDIQDNVGLIQMDGRANEEIKR